MNTFTTLDTPAQIVKQFPQASDIFKNHKIDFCCGGDKPLNKSFSEQEIDGSDILTELNMKYKEWKDKGNVAFDWEQVSLSEIVDYIITNHHAFLKEELSPLSDFVTKIFRVHGTDHPHLSELYRVYSEFKVEVETHTFDEETNVFPLIIQYEKNPSEELLKQIRVANNRLEEEHDHAGDLLKEMSKLTNNFTPPASACSSYQITYARLAELEENMFQHVHIENNILFPQL